MMKRTLILTVMMILGYVDRCSSLSVNGIVYRKIDDSDPLNVTFDDRSIELDDDHFHLLIVNESLPRLFAGSIRIRNELYVLQIRNVGLAEIEPRAFNVTPTLALLKISYNPLTTLRKDVFGGLRVKEIDCSYNNIRSIDDEAFDRIPTLEVLRLSYNAIKRLSPSWFDGSPNVYKLSVIFNELTHVPAEAFRNMAKRRPLKLRLSANQIAEIDERAFRYAGDVDVLRLNGNKLSSVPDSVFADRRVARLELNTNALLCLPESMFDSGIESLAFVDNLTFKCSCLDKVRRFVERRKIDVWYPAVICEDRTREVNIVYNFNKTYEVPLLVTSTTETLT